MTKQEKIAFVEELTEKLKEKPNVYIANAQGLSVEQANQLRGLCFDAGIEVRVVKNTLLKKAMDAQDIDYSPIYDVLKNQSTVFFVGEESTNAPGKVIKKFRKTSKLPLLKGAFIEEAVFIGDEMLEKLASLKSKNELIGEVITLLQSPAKNVISALQSGKNKLAGIIKTLSEKEN